MGFVLQIRGSLGARTASSAQHVGVLVGCCHVRMAGVRLASRCLCADITAAFCMCCGVHQGSTPQHMQKAAAHDSTDGVCWCTTLRGHGAAALPMVQAAGVGSAALISHQP